MASLTEQLTRLLHESGAQRVCCIKALWSPGSLHRPPGPTDVWIEHEVCDGLPSIMAGWQGRPANGHWEGLLLALKQYSRVASLTRELPRGKLRAMLVQDRVVYSEACTLGHRTEHEQRYVVLHFTRLPETTLSRRANEISKALHRELAGD